MSTSVPLKRALYKRITHTSPQYVVSQSEGSTRYTSDLTDTIFVNGLLKLCQSNIQRSELFKHLQAGEWKSAVKSIGIDLTEDLRGRIYASLTRKIEFNLNEDCIRSYYGIEARGVNLGQEYTTPVPRDKTAVRILLQQTAAEKAQSVLSIAPALDQYKGLIKSLLEVLAPTSTIDDSIRKIHEINVGWLIHNLPPHFVYETLEQGQHHHRVTSAVGQREDKLVEAALCCVSANAYLPRILRFGDCQSEKRLLARIQDYSSLDIELILKLQRVSALEMRKCVVQKYTSIMTKPRSKEELVLFRMADSLLASIPQVREILGVQDRDPTDRAVNNDYGAVVRRFEGGLTTLAKERLGTSASDAELKNVCNQLYAKLLKILLQTRVFTSAPLMVAATCILQSTFALYVVINPQTWSIASKAFQDKALDKDETFVYNQIRPILQQSGLSFDDVYQAWYMFSNASKFSTPDSETNPQYSFELSCSDCQDPNIMHAIYVLFKSKMVSLMPRIDAKLSPLNQLPSLDLVDDTVYEDHGQEAGEDHLLSELRSSLAVSLEKLKSAAKSPPAIQEQDSVELSTLLQPYDWVGGGTLKVSSVTRNVFTHPGPIQRLLGVDNGTAGFLSDLFQLLGETKIPGRSETMIHLMLKSLAFSALRLGKLAGLAKIKSHVLERAQYTNFDANFEAGMLHSEIKKIHMVVGVPGNLGPDHIVDTRSGKIYPVAQATQIPKENVGTGKGVFFTAMDVKLNLIREIELTNNEFNGSFIPQRYIQESLLHMPARLGDAVLKMAKSVVKGSPRKESRILLLGLDGWEDVMRTLEHRFRVVLEMERIETRVVDPSLPCTLVNQLLAIMDMYTTHQDFHRMPEVPVITNRNLVAVLAQATLLADIRPLESLLGTLILSVPHPVCGSWKSIVPLAQFRPIHERLLEIPYDLLWNGIRTCSLFIGVYTRGINGLRVITEINGKLMQISLMGQLILCGGMAMSRLVALVERQLLSNQEQVPAKIDQIRAGGKADMMAYLQEPVDSLLGSKLLVPGSLWNPFDDLQLCISESNQLLELVLPTERFLDQLQGNLDTPSVRNTAKAKLAERIRQIRKGTGDLTEHVRGTCFEKAASTLTTLAKIGVASVYGEVVFNSPDCYASSLIIQSIRSNTNAKGALSHVFDDFLVNISLSLPSIKTQGEAYKKILAALEPSDKKMLKRVVIVGMNVTNYYMSRFVYALRGLYVMPIELKSMSTVLMNIGDVRSYKNAMNRFLYKTNFCIPRANSPPGFPFYMTPSEKCWVITVYGNKQSKWTRFVPVRDGNHGFVAKDALGHKIDFFPDIKDVFVYVDAQTSMSSDDCNHFIFADSSVEGSKRFVHIEDTGRYNFI